MEREAREDPLSGPDIIKHLIKPTVISGRLCHQEQDIMKHSKDVPLTDPGKHNTIGCDSDD